jgi:hypothetical protein
MYFFKSKCKNISICYGCLNVERDIEAEVEIEENTTPAPPLSADISTTATEPQHRALRRYSSKYDLVAASRRPSLSNMDLVELKDNTKGDTLV